jgi:hypothetical protein
MASEVQPGRYEPSVKELLVLLPVFGSALAITFDVGFFYGLGISYFTLFSLSEHIVFALEALPFGLLAALILPCTFLALSLSSRFERRFYESADNERIDKATRRMRKLLLAISGFSIGAGLLGLVFFQEVLVGITFVVAGSGGLFGYLIPEILRERRKEFYVAWYVLIFIGMAFGLGIERGKSVWTKDTITHTISKTGSIGELQGRLIRSGERGVLFFDASLKTVRFIIWNDIGGINTVAP